MRVVHPAAVSRPDLREAVRGDVNRAAPGVLEADIAEHGQEVSEVADHPGNGCTVGREDRPDASIKSSCPDPGAEGDPAILGGAEIADREARVGQRLAAGPADLRQAIGDRLGDDHVAAPGQDAGPEAGPAGRPGVRGQDHLVSGDSASHGGQIDRLAGCVEVLHLGRFVDLHTTLQEHPPQSPSEACRLDGGGARHEEAFTECGRGAGSLHLGGLDMLQLTGRAEVGQLIRQALPVIRGRREGVHPQVSVRRVPGVDAVIPAPGADALDHLVGRLRELQAGLWPETFHKIRQLLPPAVQEAAVATARPAAADIGLQDGDLHAGSHLGQEPGSPHSRVAAADDRHVHGQVAGHRRGRERDRLGSERLAEPPRAAHTGDRQRGGVRRGGHDRPILAWHGPFAAPGASIGA